MKHRKVIYKQQLRRELTQAKEEYETALFKYGNTSISDPLWDEVRKRRDNAKIQLLTAESRLKNLNRASSGEEFVTRKTENNRNNQNQ